MHPPPPGSAAMRPETRPGRRGTVPGSGRATLAHGRLPPVVPIALYNGEPPWDAAREVAELIAPGPAGLERYRPQLVLVRYASLTHPTGLWERCPRRDAQASARRRHRARPELPEGLSVSVDEAMLAERVKEWPRLTPPRRLRADRRVGHRRRRCSVGAP